MEEKTFILDGSNPKKDNEERTKIVNNESFKNDLAEKQKKQVGKMKTLKNMALMGGGAGVAVLAMGLMPSNADEFNPEEPIVVPDEPQQATGVNEQMTYNEAWDAAREEVGPGGYFVWRNEQFSTYSQEEWNNLDAEDQKVFEENMHEDYAENLTIEQDDSNIAFVVQDNAPLAESVSEDMSFGDAFAMARQETGPGGVFEWRGTLYNTYYKDEWENMSDEDKSDFVASYQNVAPEGIAYQSDIEYTPNAELVSNEGEIFLEDEIVTNEYGEEMRIGYFKQGDEYIVKIDVDNDNQYDYIADPETNQLIGLNGNEDVDLNQFADEGGVEPIMSETIQIEGYDALVTVYSDGHQEALIDIDGDGTYDTKLSVDLDGNLEVYDSYGNLVDQQVLDMGEEDIPTVEEDLYVETGTDYIDNQLEDDDFGDDFNDSGDVSGWMNDELV